MSENKVDYINSTSETDEQQKEFRDVFLPQVHRIGRITMLIAFALSFLPVLFFLVVKGYTAPVASYISTAVAITSAGLGLWLTEPLAYWPVLGSAGTYIGYLSGNVSGTRFPVALNLQSTMNANINTLRGQIVTIVGIVASVFSNLVLLLIFVLGGEWLIGIFPEVVMASFAFVMAGLYGSLIIMTCNDKSGIIKAFLKKLPYLVVAYLLRFVVFAVPALEAYFMAIVVAICILLGYAIYKWDCKKDVV